jgi:predicted RNA-binding Zn-ribbon protein involved in translation (DUF1610 family)
MASQSNRQPKRRLPSVRAIQRRLETYEGYCIDCGDWTRDGCEPDAREYECPDCGGQTVYGAEELLFMIVP